MYWSSTKHYSAYQRSTTVLVVAHFSSCLPPVERERVSLELLISHRRDGKEGSGFRMSGLIVSGRRDAIESCFLRASTPSLTPCCSRWILRRAKSLSATVTQRHVYTADAQYTCTVDAPLSRGNRESTVGVYRLDTLGRNPVCLPASSGRLLVVRTYLFVAHLYHSTLESITSSSALFFNFCHLLLFLFLPGGLVTS
jgi:hypothetical protein